MSLSKLTENLNVHQSLADDPSLTPEQLKAKWDEAVNKIKNYLNETLTSQADTLIASLQSKDTNLQSQINTTNSKVDENAGTLTSAQLNLIYPIGSIYMSVNSTNPNTLFGGTWQRIQDRFLLASGSTYANGTTGGNPTHSHTNPSTSYSGNTGSTALTINQIPSHTHGYTHPGGNWTNTNIVEGQGIVSRVNPTTANTEATGGSQGHTHTMNHTHSIGNTGSSSNMPPYLAVYIWKRTA